MTAVLGVIAGVVFVTVRMCPAPGPAANITAPVSTPAREPAPEQIPAPTPVSAPTPAPPPVPLVTTAPETRRQATQARLPTVTSAQLCRSLATSGEWRCDAASGTVAPGTLYFYTRVASAAETTVEHRWYLGDRLYQRVELRIGSNQSGFRTYSRTTINSERAGPWKVELRSADGRVLHDENFVVR